jgi:hypothetical protein
MLASASEQREFPLQRPFEVVLWLMLIVVLVPPAACAIVIAKIAIGEGRGIQPDINKADH